MFQLILGALIMAHGAVIAMIWGIPAADNSPFNASHSWLLGDVRVVALTLAVPAVAGFVVAGIGVIGGHSWWSGFGVAAGIVALVLMALYFNPWLIAGIAISATILVAGILQLRGA